MTREQIEDPNEILDSLEELQDIEQQVGAILKAIRLADLSQDDQTGMRARIALLYLAPRTRYAHEMLTAFTWCHGRLESDPQRFDAWEDDIIEMFDLIIVTLVDFPQVTLEQLEKGINQMEQCYRRLQLPLRRVAEQRFSTAMRTGDLQKAESLLHPWRSCGEPESPEAAAWERLSEFELLVLQGELEPGLKVLSRNLRNRNGLSPDVFVWSVSHALRPLYLLGRLDEAAKLQRQALPLLKNEPTDALGAGAHIAFLSRAGRLDEAAAVFEEFLQPGMEAPDPDAHFRIFAAAAGLFSKLQEQDPACRLRLPAAHALHQPDGAYECAALQEWFASSARKIGDQFDTRNGNNYFNNTLYSYYNY